VLRTALRASCSMIDELTRAIEAFRTHAERHGTATNTGDSRSANSHFRAMESALGDIRTFGERGHDALLHLLSTESAAVRCWAARYSLAHDEEKAIRALEELANTPAGVWSFNARMVLVEWRAGRLDANG